MINRLDEIAEAVNSLSKRIHDQAAEQGWWDNERQFGTLCALEHSEISESMEAHRKGLTDEHLPHYPGWQVEKADAIIRILDVCGKEDVPIGDIIIEKLRYNWSRKDHTREHRAAEGGKKY